MTTPSHIHDAGFWLTLAAIFVLLILSALLSASETALGAASRTRLRARADKGETGAQAALDLTTDRDRLAGAILLGRMIAAILAASLATSLFDRLSGGNGVLAATLVIAALFLVLAEALPRSYAISGPEDAAVALARPARLLTALLSPPLALLRAIGRRLLAPLGIRADPASDLFSVQEEIADALSIGEATGAVHKEDRDRLLGALDLGNRTVAEIMLHRSQIQMIDAAKPATDILDAVLASPHTRLPVFRDERENVVGVIHAKDLLRAVNRAVRQSGDRAAVQDFDVMAVASKPYFIPETTALDEQMREFLKRRAHFALVVDEYGFLRGLVTLEDILEEIVGEIADEHDREADQTLTPDAQGSYTVEGAMTIRDLNRQLDWTLPDDEANTVAGLVIHMAQSIPDEGQVFSFGGYRFEVVSRRENRIARLRIRPAEPARR